MTTLSERTRIRSEVTLAARILATNWPIDTFIAVNPLGGLEGRPFGEAVTTMADALGSNGFPGDDVFRQGYADGRITDAHLEVAAARRYPELSDLPPVSLGGRLFRPVEVVRCDLVHGAPGPGPSRRFRMRSESAAPPIADAVDAESAKWCAAYLDSGQASWTMPGREKGFYAAWRDLVGLDRGLPGRVRVRLRVLPYAPEDAVSAALSELRVPESDVRAYLTAHLTRLPGWAAQVNWRGTNGDGIDVLSYLAMRLSYEAAMLAEDRITLPTGRVVLERGSDNSTATPTQRAELVAAVLAEKPASATELADLAAVLDLVTVDRQLLWLDALEFGYRDDLLTRLRSPRRRTTVVRPAAQVVCCIDVRSEGLRRRVEATGRYETLGFAGFFAVAIRFRELAGGEPSDLCPVLLKPRNDIIEFPLPGMEAAADRRVLGDSVLAGGQDAFHAAKDDIAAPFALAEAAGWIAGPIGALKTLNTRGFGALRRRLQAVATPAAPTQLNVTEGFTFEEQVLFGEVALTMMGLTRNFGRLVVLCGHGSSTENNPYESALDCGACGGNRGAPNARTAAAILNRLEVREALVDRGIAVPADTWFLPAEHDTAIDHVELLDLHLVPDDHRSELGSLTTDLAAAGAGLAAERVVSLPGARRRLRPAAAAAHVRARSTDWAQVFPEWGLAGNAAFIVGPRSMTRDVDLQRRTFLHSYDAEVDRDGSALETILTAPLVVAQWINCQYYFSTVDQQSFGSGSKTIHNVVGGVGVLSGHNGDLRLGLPWQSVSDGRRLMHEPLRLFAVVQAPLARIEDIIGRNTVLQNLFHNDWVALAARDDAAAPWHRYTSGGWIRWSTTEGIAR